MTSAGTGCWSQFCKIELPAADHRGRCHTLSVPDGDWTTPPTTPQLSAHEIHLWQARLDIPEDSCRQLAWSLSTDERVRAKRLHFDISQRRFIVGRAMLRVILSSYLGVEAANLFFFYDRNGKPCLAPSPHRSSLHFNLAHSENVVLYAITRDFPVGVDVEHLRPIREADLIASRFFSLRESAELFDLEGSQRDEVFLNAWTRKEACVKAVGIGLDESFAEVEVTMCPEDPARILGLPEHMGNVDQWSLGAFKPAPGYTAAVAVQLPQFTAVSNRVASREMSFPCVGRYRVAGRRRVRSLETTC